MHYRNYIKLWFYSLHRLISYQDFSQRFSCLRFFLWITFSPISVYIYIYLSLSTRTCFSQFFTTSQRFHRVFHSVKESKKKKKEKKKQFSIYVLNNNWECLIPSPQLLKLVTLIQIELKLLTGKMIALSNIKSKLINYQIIWSFDLQKFRSKCIVRGFRIDDNFFRYREWKLSRIN